MYTYIYIYIYIYIHTNTRLPFMTLGVYPPIRQPYIPPYGARYRNMCVCVCIHMCVYIYI